MTTPAKPVDKKTAAAAQAATKKKVWKQGELEKQGGFHGGWKTWNKRWFVLTDDGVSYYKDENAYLKGEKEKGYLHMDDQFAIKDQQDEVGHDERYFRIQSSGKTLIVKAKSVEDKRAWIEIVQKLKSVLIHDVYLRGGNPGATNGAGQDNPFDKRTESDPLLSPSSKKMNSQSLKEGYLKKLGEKVQSWKLRYFVLLKDSLEYYKDESLKSKQGYIRLTDQTLVTAINLPHTFTITPVPGGRKYVITATDDKQRDEWMARLHTLAGIKMTVIFPDKPKEAMKINTAEHEKALEKLLSGQESNKNAQQDFVNYCKSIFSEENVLFYLDVERYKKLDDQNDAAKLADVIASKYFEPGAEFEVAVPPQVKQQLMTDIKARKMTKTMFDHAQKILFQLILVDIVPKYLSRNPADVADTAKQAQEREEKESKVESCTLDQLIQALTSVKLQDLNIRRALLLNYKQIMKAPDLLGRLEVVYQKDASTYEDARLCVGTKLLVVGVIQEWIRSYFNDIKEIMDAVNNCLKNWVDDAMKGIQAEMKSSSPSDGGWNILHSELRSTQALIDEMRDEEEAAAEAKMLEDDDELIFEKAPERADICDYPVQMLANCMTMRDFKMFAAINPREFANKAWTRKETAPKNAANILKMVDEFNKRSFWVASEILNREDANERVRCIKHFVELADALHELHNFFAVFAIVSGLSMTPVLRLKQAWSKLSTAQKEKMEKLKQTTAVSYRAYRKIFKAGLGRAQIPHLAVTLKDCFQLEEISTIDENTGNINFGKFLKQYRELADLFQSQSIPYTLQTDKMVIAVLAACQMNLLKEEKMWQRSHRFEPKENKE